MKLGSYVLSGVLLLGLLAYTSCSLTGIKGNGKVVKVEKKISSFSEIEFNGVFNVILSQGEKEKLVIETDENLIDIVDVKNEGNKLIVDYKKGKSVRKPTKFNIYVTLKNIESLKMNGVGDLDNTGVLNLKTLEIDNSGVGDIDLNISSSILDIKNSGVGDVNLQGDASHLIINNSGVGDIDAEIFKAKDVKLKNSAVGDVKVLALENIDADVSGVGEVDIYGHPAVKKINNSGVGKVHEK